MGWEYSYKCFRSVCSKCGYIGHDTGYWIYIDFYEEKRSKGIFCSDCKPESAHFGK